MPELKTEIQGVQDLEQGVVYVVQREVFNATVLHPLPHLPEAKPYMRDMGTLHLEEGTELTYNGTADDLELYGDLNPQSPIFKPYQKFRDENKFVADSDVVTMNPLQVDKLARKMTEPQRDYVQIWKELSPQTREICELIGSAPISLTSIGQFTDEKDLTTAMLELKQRGLVIERTYKEEPEGKSKMISEERKAQLTTPKGPIPPLTNDEHTALQAIDSLRTQDDESLNSRRVQLSKVFGEFVDGLTTSKPELKFYSPVDLLRLTASECYRLEAEAHHALIEEKNADKVLAKLTERAQLLVDLPLQISKLTVQNGSELDEESATRLQHFAHMAEERIKDGDYFALSTLLIHKGHVIGEPNELDELIEDLLQLKEGKNKSESKQFGSLIVPHDWDIDPQGRYAKTTKEKALEYFDEANWKSTILPLATIEVRNRKKVFFVTGGFDSYFWDTAKNVMIQEIKSEDQLRTEFSGDISEGKFFVEKPKEYVRTS